VTFSYDTTRRVGMIVFGLDKKLKAAVLEDE